MFRGNKMRYTNPPGTCRLLTKDDHKAARARDRCGSPSYLCKNNIEIVYRQAKG